MALIPDYFLLLFYLFSCGPNLSYETSVAFPELSEQILGWIRGRHNLQFQLPQIIINLSAAMVPSLNHLSRQ
jgi:hypothetical protein